MIFKFTKALDSQLLHYFRSNICKSSWGCHCLEQGISSCACSTLGHHQESVYSSEYSQNVWSALHRRALHCFDQLRTHSGHSSSSLELGWTEDLTTACFTLICCVISFVLLDSYLQAQFLNFTSCNDTSASSMEKFLQRGGMRVCAQMLHG